MRRKYIRYAVMTAFLVCMFAVLAGCSKESGTKYKVYYSNSTGTKLVEKSYTTTTTDPGRLMNELIDQMNTSLKQDDYVVLKPERVSINGTRIEVKTADVYFSKEYNELSSSNELLYRSAMVKMLTQIDGIEYVKFFVDGASAEYTDGTQIGLMSAGDFVDDSNENIGDIQWVNLDLYYANKLGDKLSKTTVTVAYNKNISLEKMVVEKLINGPMNTNYGATLPSDLKLLSISLKNGICYVNLSSTFLTEMVNVSNEIPIYSIVNSLCALDTVNSVKIMINGDSNTTFRESISLDNSFEFNSDLIE